MFNYTAKVERQHSTCRITCVKTRFGENLMGKKNQNKFTQGGLEIHCTCQPFNQSKYKSMLSHLPKLNMLPSVNKITNFLALTNMKGATKKACKEQKKQVGVGVGNLHYTGEPLDSGYHKGTQEDKYRIQVYRYVGGRLLLIIF